MKNERYYYGILSKEEKAAYRMIYNGIKMRALNIVVPVYLPPNQIQDVYLATVYKGNIIKNLIMDCQSYTKYRPNETTGGIFVSWRRKEELPTGA